MRKTISPSPQVVVAIITGIMSILIAVVTFIISLYIPSLSVNKSTAQSQEINSLKSDIATLKQQMDKLNSDIAAISQNPNQSDINLQINRINTSISDINTKVVNLEQVILDDPNKAVAIPLLKKDLENAQSVYDAKFLALEQSINQIYTVVIGVLVVIGLGFLGIAGTNLLAMKKTDSKD